MQFRENYDSTVRLHYAAQTTKKMPNVKVTKKKEENKKIERIIEIL